MPSQHGFVGRPIGQHEPLTVRLRNLIQGYPKGLGIIKEFLQNADDAGATTVQIVMDWRHHSTSRLPAPALDRLCGPALLIANDAVFTDADFDNVLALGQSGKRLESAKIGKFGLGFNAAYNVTDHPTLVSRQRLYVLDPHRSAVAGFSDKEGYAFELDDNLWRSCADLLSPFISGGLTLGQTDLPQTIFRLPLRTPDFARQSEISQEPFTEQDFRDIVQQVTDQASELLLFLHHLLSVQISEIPVGRNVPIALLKIETVNSTEVKDKREPITQWLHGTHAEVLRSLRRPEGRTLTAKYDHVIRVATAQDSFEASWLVANGLFTGPAGELLDLADEIFAEGQKAIPLAGAAARLEGDDSGSIRPKPIDGRVFCGLPLPKVAPLAVHVNGFFELDTSRGWLQLNTESVGAHERRRQQWNHQLIRHGVASVVTDLLAALVAKIDDPEVSTLYGLWPTVDAELDSLLPGFSKAVYERAWAKDYQVVRVPAKDPGKHWQRPRDVMLLRSEWHDRLMTPLAANEWPIPLPPLPSQMVQGFKVAGHALAELTPRVLRDRWRTDKDVNTELSAAPDPAWRERQWVIDLLRFALSDGSKDLNGLPLALLCDRKLHTFGTSTLFLAGAQERELFAQRPQWFVDPDMASSLALAATPSAKLFSMNAGLVLGNLRQFLQTDKDGVPWEPNGQTLPNASWLTRVFEYLAAQHALLETVNIDAIKTLAIIPDQFGRLSRPGCATTPLWPTDDRSDDAQFARLVRVLHVPLIHGQAKLLRAMRTALDEAVTAIVWSITGPDLVDTISNTVDSWDEDARTYAPEIHDRLLDFLSEYKPSEYSTDQLERLRGLMIFPTSDSTLVRADDPSVLVPAEARLPSPPGAHLLKVGDRGAWRGLLKALGVKVLNSLELAHRIVAADFGAFRANRRQRLLVWLRTNLEQVLTDAGAGRANLLESLSAARFVQGDDDRLHAVTELYDRRAEIARDILGGQVVFPDFADTYATDSDLWEEFFRRLRIAIEIRPADLLGYVDRLLDNAKVSGSDTVGDKLLSVFGYVRDRWNSICSQRVVDGVHGDCTLQDALRRRPWLPAQRAVERLQIFAGFQIPENRLYRPDELYAPSQGHLLASCAAIAPFRQPTREVQRGLGFPDAPRIGLVLQHFENLLEVWSEPNHSGIESGTLSRSLGAIYRTLGNRFGKASETEDETDENLPHVPENVTVSDVRERFSERDCLWDDVGKRFWLPRHTFAVPVPFFGERRSRLKLNESAADAGYEVLGRRSTVEPTDLVDFLEELEAAFGDAPLPESTQAEVISALRFLERMFVPGQHADELLLLTGTGCLLRSSRLFEDDDVYHRPFIGPGAVPVVHAQVPARLSSQLGVTSLARVIDERLAGQPQITSDAAQIRRCSRLQATLRSVEFAAGLRRILRERLQGDLMPDISWLGRIRLIPTLPFQIELWLEHDGNERQIGSMEGSFFFERHRDRVYVATDSADFVSDYLVRAIDRRLDGVLAHQSATLLRMVDAEPTAIDRMLTRLRISQQRDDEPAATEDELHAEPAETMTFADNQDESDLFEDNDMSSVPHGDDDDHDSALSAQPTDDGSANASAAELIVDDGDLGEDEPAHPEVSPDRVGRHESTVRTRSATTHHAARQTKSDRFATYVVQADDTKASQSPEHVARRRRVESSGIDHVCRYEEAAGRTVRPTAVNHEGYDLESCDGTGAVIRYIEVKSTMGQWDADGVGLTTPQFSSAQKLAEAYWLYVVEFADTSEARIHRIQNPAGRSNRFYFDRGWIGVREGDV